MAKTDLKSLIAVDVGMNALGWARWDEQSFDMPFAPTSCGVIKVGSKLIAATRDGTDWWKRFSWLLLRFRSESGIGSSPGRLVVEWPEFRSGSALGLAAAGRDNLSQLAFACGAHFADSRWALKHHVDFEMVPVSKWKGSLPKSVVEKRIARAVGLKALDGTPVTSHAVDAMGIGLFAQGHRLDSPSFSGKLVTK